MTNKKQIYVGLPLQRVDAIAKVSGKAKYIDDVHFPGELHCELVVSPYPHAFVRNLDVSLAKKVPGVVGIFWSRDIPGQNQVGCVFPDQPLLATDKVRFVGDRIAVVVARTKEAAKEAASKVCVDFEPIESVHDVMQALDASAPLVHADKPGNLAGHLKIRRGDTENPFSQADVVVEHEFHLNYQEHAYLEPQGAIAVVEQDVVVIYGSMQCPYYVQKGVARLLRLPLSKVRVVQTTTGGAFGGKEDYPTEVACVAALCAWLTGKPARLIYSRQLDFQISTKRHQAVMKYKLGARKDGHLVGLTAQLYYDAGPYLGLSTVVAERGNSTAAGPYHVKNVKVDTFIVYTNNLFTGAFRGFGTPQTTFAIESIMDMLADRLGMDPVELRRKNLLRQGLPTITGQPVPPSAPSEIVLDTLVEKGNYTKHVRECCQFNQSTRWKRRGVGIALSLYGCCLHAGGQHLEGSAAVVQVYQDGSTEIAIGGTELGQGAFTVIAQIAAEVLGAPYEKVNVSPPDTAVVPDSGPTVASRTTIMSGNAVRSACLKLSGRLKALAAEEFGCTPSEVNVEAGIYRCGDKEIAFEQLCALAYRRKVNLGAQGWYAPPPRDWDVETGQGTAYWVYCFTGHLALVEVDLVAGLVKVEKVVGVHDVGKVINPATLLGQAEGGIVQGMGWATCENLIVNQGKVLNPSLTDYLIPTAKEAPDMKIYFIEEPYPDGPFGAKGIGEPALISVPAAVAAAISNAVGHRFDRLPITPEAILKVTVKE